MEIPKIIMREGHKYIFIQQCNENLYLYKEMLYGYKECFKQDELYSIKENKKRGRKPKYEQK